MLKLVNHFAPEMTEWLQLPETSCDRKKKKKS